MATANGSYPRQSSQYAPNVSLAELPEASLATNASAPSTTGSAVGQNRTSSARDRGRVAGASSQRHASAADPGDVEDPELRPRKYRGGDRPEDGELAEDARPLEGERDRVQRPHGGQVREALGHHGDHRDGRGNRDGQGRRDHRPPLRDDPAGEEVHGHRRQREEERVRRLEPVVGRVDASRDAQDRGEHQRQERPEAVVLSAEREALALDERGRGDQVALLVRVYARPAGAEREQRVEDERGRRDEPERHDRSAIPTGVLRRHVVGGRGAETLGRLQVGRHDRAMLAAPGTSSRRPSLSSPPGGQETPMSVATRARRLAAPVGRPLRRAAVGLRTRDWQPHSHLFIAQEGADWVLAYEARQLEKLAAGLGIPVGPERWVNAVAGQAIFHESQFTLLLDDFDARGNRLGFAYFHGRPGTAGFPEFDVCYRRLTQRHAEIDGVQVTNGAMESLVLETGIAAEKVHRIPIGIDPVAFPFRTDDVKARSPPGARASRHRLRRRLVPEGRRRLGRRAGAQADQGPGRPGRGGLWPTRARPRPVVPAHRPLAGLRQGGARARRHPLSAPLPSEPRVGGAGVRGDRPLHRCLA